MKKTITIALFITALSPLLNPIPALARTRTNESEETELSETGAEYVSFTLSNERFALEKAREIYLDQMADIEYEREYRMIDALRKPSARERANAQKYADQKFRKHRSTIKARLSKATTNIKQLYSPLSQ